MEKWEQKFIGHFLYHRPVGTYERTIPFLTKVKMHMSYYSVANYDSWYLYVPNKCTLSTNNVACGESYNDGTGWFKPYVDVRGRGIYTKMRRMVSFIEEHMTVLERVNWSGYDSTTMILFRRPMINPMMVGRTQGFTSYITSKYAGTT